MIDIGQFREYVIKPVLEGMELYSLAAEELLLGTAIQESRLTYLKQLGGGPAMGVFQMEPATHDDIWENYLEYHQNLAADVACYTLNCIADRIYASELLGNLYYAAAMCRVHYFRVSEALPAAGDLEGQAAYWKQYYNTPMGAGTVDEYIENWNKYVGEDL